MKWILSALFITGSLYADMRIVSLQGEAIQPYVKDITELCLVIYREYPYLYEGTEAEYGPFIQEYAQSPHGIACLLFDDEKPVGVAIGVPLSAMRKNYQDGFAQFAPELTSVYYLAEFLLLTDYRNKGYGRELYRQFESLIPAEYPTLSFCKIAERDTHPLMPQNYSPVDTFWRKLGYTEHKDWSFFVSWDDVGTLGNSSHQLIYWTKEHHE